MTSVNTNISASKAALSMSSTNNAQVKSAKRLSSGTRINSGSDDAAGIAVSSKMNAIFMGQKSAIKAATDAISMLKVQEAGLEQLTNILQRIRELAVQMSNGSYSDVDRGLAQLESDALLEQFLMVATNTRFNEKQVLSGTLPPPTFETIDIQSGPTADESFTIALIPGVLLHGGIVSADLNKVDTQALAKATMDGLAVENGPMDILSNAQATLGSSINRLSHTVSYLTQANVYTETAIGRIVDTDFAREATINTKQNVLYKAASQMLAIANDTKQNLLQLFR